MRRQMGLRLLLVLGIATALPIVGASASGAFEYAYIDLYVGTSCVRETPAEGGFSRDYVADLRVCYMQSDGCRWERFRETLSIHETKAVAGPTTDPAWMKTVDNLTAKAVTKLGGDGWELIGDGPRPTLFSTPGKALWFKRSRAPSSSAPKR